MSKQKCRISLPQQTHSVRTAQAVLQYGAGAMVDFPDQTLVTAAPELWSKTQRIYDERLAKACQLFCPPDGDRLYAFPGMVFLSEVPTLPAAPTVDRTVSEVCLPQTAGERSLYGASSTMPDMPTGSALHAYRNHLPVRASE